MVYLIEGLYRRLFWTSGGFLFWMSLQIALKEPIIRKAKGLSELNNEYSLIYTHNLSQRFVHLRTPFINSVFSWASRPPGAYYAFLGGVIKGTNETSVVLPKVCLV